MIHELGLNQAADYLDMASRLVRLKAQMLLPRRVGGGRLGGSARRAGAPAARVPADQGDRASGWSARPSARAEQFARGYLPPPPELPPPPLTLDLLELLQAVERVVAGIPSPVLHRVVARPLDVEARHPPDRGSCCAEREEFGWLDALGPRPTIVDVLSTLLALLELAKRGTAPLRPIRRLRADGDRP